MPSFHNCFLMILHKKIRNRYVQSKIRLSKGLCCYDPFHHSCDCETPLSIKTSFKNIRCIYVAEEKTTIFCVLTWNQTWKNFDIYLWGRRLKHLLCCFYFYFYFRMRKEPLIKKSIRILNLGCIQSCWLQSNFSPVYFSCPSVYVVLLLASIIDALLIYLCNFVSLFFTLLFYAMCTEYFLCFC